MPDLIPAPGSTTTSAPSAFIFLMLSGVAATLGSSISTSRAIAMRIQVLHRHEHRTDTQPSRARSRAPAELLHGEREEAEQHDDDARNVRTAGEAENRRQE